MRRMLIVLSAVMALAALAQSPVHEALRKEIAELQKKPVALQLPPYLPAEKDFGEVCQQAAAKKKRVLVSIGREACGRCQRFYEMVQRGVVKFDTNTVEYVRLDIDEYTQREYFLGAFDPPNGHLPFVGVIDGEIAPGNPCLTGAPSAAEYQKLIDKKKQ